ncbi:hypothetical protein MAPG_09060 [Magnaporthiopsis poae ATCC 64411]|uniref:Uncharacterized protein n=1 Tax=Magnaporthiopsis poae (strain ATCC 64411 / 73-15) TaxID=644358 RepID=A0A0C4E8Y8_MAGP6|nr:hypothetical protein MAPG_09060 [Magnaporthiopsis poae ATCC 64411]
MLRRCLPTASPTASRSRHRVARGEERSGPRPPGLGQLAAAACAVQGGGKPAFAVSKLGASSPLAFAPLPFVVPDSQHLGHKGRRPLRAPAWAFYFVSGLLSAVLPIFGFLFLDRLPWSLRYRRTVRAAETGRGEPVHALPWPLGPNRFFDSWYKLALAHNSNQTHNLAPRPSLSTSPTE